MTDKAKEARREYKRKWAQNNPEKVREQQRRYWEKRAQTDDSIQQQAQEEKVTV